ncbi:hypothetical protein, conserved [Plasmodium gonderi]|uniref:Uncharacterized protein n=1 Tax=Plasmodium gonderi TaxID=77519 RepID=A0A1Y1J9L4_PLAGO|nr:hypothetical protein, conserved [Plasmodium gonderi]GAW79189.1 hypothetical protein, conserved [Plasmodium gonderi]
MGRGIKESYNLRHRYLDKRKEENLNVLKSPRNKIICKKETSVANTSTLSWENKDECNKNTITNARKAKLQKGDDLRKNQESVEENSKRKDMIKYISKEKSTDKLGKNDEDDKNEKSSKKYTNSASEGSDSNKKGYKNKKYQLNKSEENDDNVEVYSYECTEEYELAENRNKKKIHSDDNIMDRNSLTMHNQNYIKLHNHSDFTKNKINVNLYKEEKDIDVNSNKANNYEEENVYNPLDKTGWFNEHNTTNKSANTAYGCSRIVQSNFITKDERETYSHNINNVYYRRSCNGEHNFNESINNNIIRTNLNAQLYDHIKGDNYYYNKKKVYNVVENNFHSDKKMNEKIPNNRYNLRSSDNVYTTNRKQENNIIRSVTTTNENNLSSIQNSILMDDYNMINEKTYVKKKQNVHNVNKMCFQNEYPDNLINEKKLNRNYYCPEYIKKKLNELTNDILQFMDMNEKESNDIHSKHVNHEPQMHKTVLKNNNHYDQINNNRMVENINNFDSNEKKNNNYKNIQTCKSHLINDNLKNLNDEDVSHTNLRNYISTKSFERREKYICTSSSNNQNRSNSYHTRNDSDASEAYSSSHNNRYNDNCYNNTCNNNNNVRSANIRSGNEDVDDSDGDKNGDGDDDGRKDRCYDEKNNNDDYDNYFNAENGTRVDNFKNFQKTNDVDCHEQPIKKTTFYSMGPPYEEVESSHKKMLNKHTIFSRDLQNKFCSQKNEKENSPNNKYTEKGRYVRNDDNVNDDIMLPINKFPKKIRESHNWDKEDCEIINSLNEIVCEVKKKSNMFVSSYKNREMSTDNNNNSNNNHSNNNNKSNNNNNNNDLLRSKIDSNIFSGINKSGNDLKNAHLLNCEDNFLKKKTNADYANNYIHTQKMVSNHASLLKHASNLRLRYNSLHRDVNIPDCFGYINYKNCYIDDIKDVNANLREHGNEKSLLGKDKCPTNYDKVNNLKMNRVRSEQEDTEDSINCVSFHTGKNFKIIRSNSFAYSNDYIRKNKIKENNYSKKILQNHVEYNIDNNFISTKKKENINIHEDPFNEHPKLRDQYVNEKHDDKDNLSGSNICNKFRRTEKSKEFQYIQKNKTNNHTFDNSLINSYLYLKNELKDMDDIHSSMSNGIKTKEKLLQNRNLSTKSMTILQNENHYNSSSCRENNHLMNHYHRMMKSDSSNIEKEMNKTKLCKRNKYSYKNSAEYNEYANNDIVIEDDTIEDDAYYGNIHENEKMTFNRNHVIKKANTVSTKYYTEKRNSYEYTEDGNFTYSENNNQSEKKPSYLIINNAIDKNDQMNYMSFHREYALYKRGLLDVNGAPRTFISSDKKKGIYGKATATEAAAAGETENDNIEQVISSDVETTDATPNWDDYNAENRKNNYHGKNRRNNEEILNKFSTRKKTTIFSEFMNNSKTLRNNYITRSKSNNDIKYNYSDHSSDSIYDWKRRSMLYEYGSVGRKQLVKQERSEEIEPTIRKRRKMKSLNGIDIDYQDEDLMEKGKKPKKKSFMITNEKKNFSSSKNGNTDRIESRSRSNSSDDKSVKSFDLFAYDHIDEEDSLDIRNDEFHDNDLTCDNLNYEKGKIKQYRQRITIPEYNSGIKSTNMKSNRLGYTDYYRNYDSIQCVKGDLLKNENFPFIFYDSNIRNLVIYYKDNYSNEIKCKYFSAQRFGHATAKKIALDFLRSLGINPDHLENNSVFSYEKDSKSKLVNMARGRKAYMDKEENSNIDITYDKKKRNVIVSWINKVKGYSMRKFSTQRFGFDVALSLSIDFYKNLGGEKKEEEIRRYVNTVNSNFKSIRIPTSKRNKRKLKNKKKDVTREHINIYSNSDASTYEDSSLSHFCVNNVKYNVENMKDQSTRNGIDTSHNMHNNTNLFNRTDKFYQDFECKFNFLHMEQVKLDRIYQYDFFLNKTFYFLYLKYLENVKSALCDENFHIFTTMSDHVSMRNYVKSRYKRKLKSVYQHPKESITNYFQIVDFYCDIGMYRKCKNGNMNYFMSKMSFYKDEDIFMKGYYTSDDTKMYDFFFLSNSRKHRLEQTEQEKHDDTSLANRKDSHYYERMYREKNYHNNLFKKEENNGEIDSNRLSQMQKRNERIKRNTNIEKGKNLRNPHFYNNNWNDNLNDDRNDRYNTSGSNCSNNDSGNNKKYKKQKKSHNHNDYMNEHVIEFCNEKGKDIRKRKVSKNRKNNKTKGRRGKVNTLVRKNSTMYCKKSEIVYEQGNEDRKMKRGENGEKVLRNLASCKKNNIEKNKIKSSSTGRGKNKGAHRGTNKKKAHKGTNKRIHKRTIKNLRKETSKGITRGIHKGNRKEQHNMTYLKNKKFSSTNKNISNLFMKGRKYIVCYNFMGKIQVKVFSADIYGVMTAQRKSVVFLQQVRKELNSEGKILYSENDSKTAYDVTISLMKSEVLNPPEHVITTMNKTTPCIGPSVQINSVLAKKGRGRRKKVEDLVEVVGNVHLKKMNQVLEKHTKQEEAKHEMNHLEKKYSRGKTYIGRNKENEMIIQKNDTNDVYMKNYEQNNSKDDTCVNSKLRDSVDYKNSHYTYRNEGNNENESMRRACSFECKIMKSNNQTNISENQENYESLMKTYSSNELLHGTFKTQNKRHISKTDNQYENASFIESFKNESDKNRLEPNEYINDTCSNEHEDMVYNKKKMNYLSCTTSDNSSRRYSNETEYEISTMLSNTGGKRNSNTIKSENEDEKDQDVKNKNESDQISMNFSNNLDIRDSNSKTEKKNINIISDKKNPMGNDEKGEVNNLNCFNKLNSEQKVVKGYLTLRKEKFITPNVKRVYSLCELYNKIINECDYTDFLSQNCARKVVQNRKGNPNDNFNDDFNDDSAGDTNADTMNDHSTSRKQKIMKNSKTQVANKDHIQRAKRNQYSIVNNELANEYECHDPENFKKEIEVGTTNGSHRDVETTKTLKNIEIINSNITGSPRNLRNDCDGLVKYKTSKGIVKIPKICVHKLARKKGYTKLTCIIYRGKGEFVSYFLERGNKKINNRNMLQNEIKDDETYHPQFPLINGVKSDNAKLSIDECSSVGNSTKEQDTQSSTKYFLREK